MLSTDTIFVLKDRFDGRSNAETKSGSEAAESGCREPRRDFATIAGGQPTRLVEKPGGASAAESAANPSPGDFGRGELSAMRGILMGVAFGAFCWAVLLTGAYRFFLV